MTLVNDIRENVRHALAEDVGAGDVTAALIPDNRTARARVLARESAVLCGTAWFDAVFQELDSRVRVKWLHSDGDRVAPDEILCDIEGPARAILTGERSALNFLQTLSGTATLARRYADAVRDTNAVVLDTRKTLPGLRIAQKYATRCGGCENHRMGLYDAILIKENHIAAAGSIKTAIAQAYNVADVPIEVEVENLSQLQDALDAGAKRVLLDNFTIDMLKQAVKQTAGGAKLEASGGINLENVRAIAQTGVDYISIGGLTKNVQAVDLSLQFVD